MKAAQREIYQVLANEVGYCLCDFCKYVDAPDCTVAKCCHPLAEVFSFQKQIDSAMEMGDCWAFRPAYPVPLVADIVGTILANGWDWFSLWQEEDEVWRIAGGTF